MATRKKPPSPADRFKLAPERARWSCDPAAFKFETTAELEDKPISIIGQPRAMEALKLGLSIRSDGYNIFVAGEVGTGRSTTVRRRLQEVERGGTAPDDQAYVHNFHSPDRPRLLTFPAGQGRKFARGMEALVERTRQALSDLFDSEEYQKRRNARIQEAKDAHKERLKEFEKQIESEGFTVVQVQMGPLVRPDLLPVVAGNPVNMDQLESLVEQGKFDRKEFETLKEKRTGLTTTMETLTKETQRQERDLRKALAEMDRTLARPLVDALVAPLREEFPGEAVNGYLTDVVADVLEHLDRFRQRREPAGAEEGKKKDGDGAMIRYAVNLLVDHSRTKGRPIIWETSPSYRNLFGVIEKAREGAGEWKTDHTHIRAGSVLQANGGFLVLDAMDVLVEPGVWAALKRTMRNRVLEIQSFDPLHIFGGLSLKPEPVPVDVKVVMIGTHQIYRLLYALDEDFKKIFKVKADLCVQTPISDAEILNYARFVQKKCRDDRLPPFHKEAVAAVVEEGVRLAGRQDKLTTRFKDIADVIREAGYWAHEQKAKTVTRAHVDRAVRERAHRLDRVEELLRERIAEGTILLDVEGKKIGQVNGLSVLDVGDYQFGQPSRITAVTAMGRSGIVDIERESRMSGAIHTKGVLILAGFLRARFAQDKPLALAASLCFEQNYGPIDGDSASSAELYALLSSLSDVPLTQSVAVTGSVNQKGEIQPIGGVNQKIEGFFDLCRMKGLTRGQGVMIPAANLPHLMLRKDVVEAMAKGRFHLWAVSTVEEGIEVLTGMPAGVRGPDGAYPSDSVFGRADARLKALAEGVRAYGLAAAPPARPAPDPS